MKVQETKRNATLLAWANQIQEHKQSGMSVREWSATYGFSPKTYYYRLKRVREELLEAAVSGNRLCLSEEPVFAALPMPRTGNPAVTVRIGRYSIEIQNDASAKMVEHVLLVVSRS